MRVTKEVTLKIELSGEELESFKDALISISAVENASNAGIGFLKNNEKKILESILRSIETS